MRLSQKIKNCHYPKQQICNRYQIHWNDRSNSYFCGTSLIFGLGNQKGPCAVWSWLSTNRIS